MYNKKKEKKDGFRLRKFKYHCTRVDRLRGKEMLKFRNGLNMYVLLPAKVNPFQSGRNISRYRSSEIRGPRVFYADRRRRAPIRRTFNRSILSTAALSNENRTDVHLLHRMSKNVFLACFSCYEERTRYRRVFNVHARGVTSKRLPNGKRV